LFRRQHKQLSEYWYVYSRSKMKLSCLLLICLTNMLLRLSAYDLISGEKFRQTVILTVLLAFLLVSFHRRRSLTGVTAAKTTVPPSRCRNGYNLYSGPGRGFCFRFSDDCIPSFDAAQKVCQKEGGDLAVLDDESLRPFLLVLKAKLKYVDDCYGPYAYLGAKSDEKAEPKYISGGKIPLDESLWAFYNMLSPNRCVIALIDNDGKEKLFDQPCTGSYRYVCQQF
ncbi:hypothetical protein CHS0354_027575, partial [Potamilus streckersoni]